MEDNQNLQMVETGRKGNSVHYRIMPSGIGRSAARNSIEDEYKGDSSKIFDDIASPYIQAMNLDVDGHSYQFVPFGLDNQLPYKLKDKVMSNMITAQCQYFNILACYGRGVRFVDRVTKMDTDDEDVLRFCLANSLHEEFLEQATDMKMYFFSVTVIILSRDGSKIVKMANKDASFCRFEYAPSTKSGRIEHVFYSDWREGVQTDGRVEVIPLLDMQDPLGDLQVRMGITPDPMTGVRRSRTDDRKFAIVSRMPTPGCQYYPVPYYASIYRDAWDDIYRLIGLGKRYMIKNTSAPRVQIEVHADYWDSVCDNELIFDEAKRKERKEQEKRNIIEFVTGVENAGKALVSGYYVDPNGKECRMVRIFSLNDASKKEGGNWSDDMAEASNALCFAFGIHPNLVGATPGKSQMNNSGSDKRELFTLKQSLESPIHDIMCKPYHVILHYNGWNDRYTVDVPMILLTTLDQNTDAKTVMAGGKTTEDNIKTDDSWRTFGY